MRTKQEREKAKEEFRIKRVKDYQDWVTKRLHEWEQWKAEQWELDHPTRKR